MSRNVCNPNNLELEKIEDGVELMFEKKTEANALSNYLSIKNINIKQPPT